MTRLIDADALIADVTERYCKDCNKRKGMKNGKLRTIYGIGEVPCRACDVDDMKGELEDAPTVDAVPVVHGKWVEKTGEVNDATFYWYECSNCEGRPLKQWNETMLSDYCPHCGAKMDEVRG